MQWRGRRQSRNIEDRRSAGGMSGGGRRGGAGLPIGGVGLVAVVVIGYFFGIDLTPLLDGGSSNTSTASRPATLSAEDREMGDFVAVTLGDTEQVWDGIFREQLGEAYRPVTLVLYSGVTRSSCGNASGATGPFYCPVDQKVYLDTAFFRTLAGQLGARGDFAAAYVVAHEVAHHVQDELGILAQVNAERARVDEARSNALSVRVELQADCFSGVWAKAAGQMFGSIEPGDIAEASGAARRIGDDTLQRNAGRVPMPESFTHGTSAQRESWFTKGYQSGRLDSCDTFAARKI